MKKIYSITILFFLLFYNLTFSLLSFISFIQTQNTFDISQVNIQNQYKAFSNMPKEFVNVCIEISNELTLSMILKDKVSNIFADTNLKFDVNNYSIIYSNTKLKKFSVEYNNYIDKKILNCNLLVCFILFSALIFYLTRYIGLLYLFGESQIKFFFVRGKLCLYNCL